VLDLVAAPLKDTQNLDTEMGTGVFIFREGKVFTYNDRLALIASVDMESSFIVDGPVFHSLVSKLADAATAEIEVAVKKSSVVLKADGWFTGEVPLLNTKEGTAAEKFIESMSKAKLKYAAVDKKFNEALKLCQFTTSKDVTLPALTGVYFCDNRILSSDSYRVSRYTMEKGLGTRFLLSTKGVKELSRSDVVEFADSKAWAYFKTSEGVVVACRKMGAEYPEKVQESLDAALKKAKHVKEEVLPAASSDMVGICACIFSKDLGEETFVEVTMKVENKVGVFTVKSTTAAGNVLCQKKGKKWGGSSYRFMIDPNFLQLIVQQTTKFRTVGEVLIFEAGAFSYLTTYIRPDEV
jgi:hypothetical protein